MEITRTTQIQLDLDPAAAEKTVAVWSAACNFISQAAFEHGCLSNAVKLHRLLYVTVRDRFGLSAQVTQNAIRHVAAKYAAARTAKRALKAPVAFRQCAVALQGGERGRDFGFKRQGLSVWTVDGRAQAVAFHGEPKLAEYLDAWQMGDARLYVRKGAVFLSVSFKREVEPSTAPLNAVVGMDRGINVVAAVTNGHGEQLFGGGHTKHVQRRYNQVRAALQKRLTDRKKAQTDTRSVRRVLKRLSGREKRFQRNSNHVISRRIVDYAHQSGNSAIAMEDLGGIREGRRLRKEQRSDLNRWAFYQLEQFVTYKAETLGMVIIKVDARYTSQGCSKCGHTEKANRNRYLFHCQACGHTLHAEVNAAHNIRLRGILARQVLGEDGPASIGPKARGVDPRSETAGSLRANSDQKRKPGRSH